MSDIPSTEVIRHWCACGYTGDDEAGMEHSPERVAQFEAWLAEVKAQAWTEAWVELRAIPHWWNPEQQRGGFDLGIDGTEPATEEGAFMAVREVMLANPYRQGGSNE